MACERGRLRRSTAAPATSPPNRLHQLHVATPKLFLPGRVQDQFHPTETSPLTPPRDTSFHIPADTENTSVNPPPSLPPI